MDEQSSTLKTISLFQECAIINNLTVDDVRNASFALLMCSFILSEYSFQDFLKIITTDFENREDLWNLLAGDMAIQGKKLKEAQERKKTP